MICELNIKWRPYKIFKRHELLSIDLPRRLQFCHWLLDQGERYSDNFVIGDEAVFCFNGSVNTQNIREYSPMRHPLSFNYEKNMCREKWSARAGMCENGVIIGPIFLEGNLNGKRYLEIPNDIIIPHLQDKFGDRFNRLWWVLDGAPSHRFIIVRDRLNKVFNNRVIALGHETQISLSNSMRFFPLGLHKE